MGGWRCTYRSCTAKADGVTHMFHYPVFDKVRCHQWLINAKRMEFLDLKLSQLKNRCVCQHHFRDDDFMNFRKDKIKCNAIPTENGPYCDTSLEPAADRSSDEMDYTLIFEDEIANDTLSLEEKLAHYPKKYSDFLSSDLTEMHQTSLNYNTKSSKTTNDNQVIDANKAINYPHDLNFNTASKAAVVNKGTNPSYLKKRKAPPKSLVGKVIPVSLETTQKEETTYLQHIAKENVEINDNHGTQQTPKSQIPHVRPKVQIVSAKTISKPFVLTGKLEPISPSVLLTPRNLRNKKTQSIVVDSSNPVSLNEDNNCKLLSESNEKNSHPKASEEIIKKEVSDLKTEVQVFECQKITKEVEIKDSASVLKSPKNILQSRNRLSFEETAVLPAQRLKITPERLAAIEEKRQFNMKLKDVMASHLSESKKDVEPNIGKVGLETITKSGLKRKTSILKGESILSHPTQLQSVDKYGIAYIEARMKKMEATLLNKIEQNTQNILDVKKLIVKTQTKQSSVSTQTHSKSTYIKYLYKELSKYLSPNANNIVYDELFISKTVQFTPRKRRKLSTRNVPS